MGWYVRKSVKIGPMRLNFSKRGIGVSTGVKGLRFGTGPRGPYVSGGRNGLYFRQSLGGSRRRASTSHPRAATRFVPAPAPTPAGGATPPMPQPPRQFRVYPWWALAGLLLWFVVAFALTGSSSDLGAAMLLMQAIAVAVLDWDGFRTLDGLLHWERMTSGQRFWMVCAYIFFFEILLAIYLVRAVILRKRAPGPDPLALQRQIAAQEAQLGILPPTDGTCRACGKPMQVGAEFCAYCGASAVERPRICPVCATTTQPDARFCPTCRTPLGAPAGER